MKTNFIKKIVLILLFLVFALEASTISTTQQAILEEKVQRIVEVDEAFNLAISQNEKTPFNLLKVSQTSLANSDDLNVLMAQRQLEMTNDIVNNATLLLSEITETKQYFKDLIAMASSANDWELVREFKALRDETDYFSKTKNSEIVKEKNDALAMLTEVWELTGEEKGKLFNKLVQADINSTVIKVGKTFSRWINSTDENVIFSLENAPVGMKINVKSGWLTWNPMRNQLGEKVVTVIMSVDGLEVERETINLFVQYRNYMVQGFFVELSKNKRNNENGSVEYPFSDFKSACEALALDENKSSIFIRGGDYIDVETVTSISNCHGNENKKIVVSPWKSEQVSIYFKGRSGLQVRNSSYVTVQGFEVIGASIDTENVNYENAIVNWWKEVDLYQGTGIAIRNNSNHILIQKNVVHDTTASGIKAVAASSVIIKENIVYNCAWWTIQGTTGIGITLAEENAIDNDNTIAYNKMVGNFLFNNESRIYSRVWGKGEVSLRVDEGEAILVQEENVGQEAGYRGRYLIQNNFIMNNGKTVVINKAGRVDIRRNSYYMNGTTTANNKGYFSSGLRVNSSYDVTFRANAIDADEVHGLLYSVATNSEDAFILPRAVSKNIGRGAVQEGRELVEGITRVYSQVFKAPKKGNFTIINDENTTVVGADINIMNRHKLLIKRYGISLEPISYVVDNRQMTQDVIDNIPEGANIIESNYDGTKESYLLITNLPDEHPYVVYQREHNKTIIGVKLHVEFPESISY